MNTLEDQLVALQFDESARRQIHDALRQSTDPMLAHLGAMLAAALAVASKPRAIKSCLTPLLRAVDAESGTTSSFERGVALHLRATIAWRSDRNLLAASTHLNRSMEALERESSPHAEAYAGRVLDTMGQLLHHQGLLHDARRAFERALAVKGHAGDRAGIALTQGNLGRLCLALADFEAAIGHLTDDLQYVESDLPNASSLICTLLTQIGVARIELDDLDLARETLERSLGMADAKSDDVSKAYALVHLARLALHANRLDDVRAHLETLGAIDPTTADQLPQVRGLASQARAQLLMIEAKDGQLEGALAEFESARSWFARASNATPVDHASMLEAYAQAAERSGDVRLAADLIRQALRELDATSADAKRRRLDDGLKRLDRHAWMLHSSGRFVGHAELARLLGEAGHGGFQGQSEDAAVLFCDLRGFTSVSERLPPDRLVSTLNRYFGHMTRCVEHYGGRIDKFIGDAVMAFFPKTDNVRPGSSMHHADRGLHAALYMQEELQRFNRFLADDLEPFVAGIGVHTGSVIAGLVGSPQRRSYTVLGDVVNTSSRLEGMTKSLGVPVLVTGEVAKCVGQPLRSRLVPLGRYRPVGRTAYVEALFVAEEAEATDLCVRADTALHLFQSRKFEEAETAFKNLAHERHGQPGSKGYTLHAHAAGAYADAPPSDGWDGAVTLTQK